MQIKLEDMGGQAKVASRILAKSSSQERNLALKALAQAILDNETEIIEANQLDIEAGRQAGLPEAMVERLTLTPARVEAMAGGLRQMASLADPIAITDKEWINRDGLRIGRRRVPLGVIGIIYESRPNVTVDAAGLCLKAGNAVILRGGKEARNSNMALVNIMQEALGQTSISPDSIQLIEDPSREIASQFMQLDQYVDCLIPRGGAGLIQSVKKNATIPVIETGVGNCHLYIHQDADMDKALSILMNGKTQRTSVCNALETLVVDKALAGTPLEKIVASLQAAGVEVRGEEEAQDLIPSINLVQEGDYDKEFLDLVIALKLVDGYQEAVDHIERYSTGHSDAIVTENYSVAQDFLRDVDSAAVYVNASTRFSDGEVFGFGGEIGISTQKLHARGPMGLEALTSYKYVILGQGQIRQ